MYKIVAYQRVSLSGGLAALVKETQAHTMHCVRRGLFILCLPFCRVTDAQVGSSGGLIAQVEGKQAHVMLCGWRSFGTLS